MAQISAFEAELPVSRDEAFAWHARPGALQRLLPPWQSVRLLHNDASLAVGSRVEMRMGLGPLGLRWSARHTELEPGRRFVDVAERGPFASWQHRHAFADIEPTSSAALAPSATSRMRDEVHWTLPFEPLSRWLAAWWVRGEIARMFRFRHARTQQDLQRHAAFADRPRLRIGLTGASGGIGVQLRAFLETGGHTVVPIGRRPGDVAFDAAAGTIDARGLAGLDAVIHLAGAPIATRWTDRSRAEILASRERGTLALARALASLDTPPKVLISASAIGWYGDRPDGAVDESDGPGQGFAADVCRRWEEAAAPAREAGIRVVHPRIGVVLDPQHGALAQMLPAFRAGLGGPMGSGRQGLSWIVLDDVLYALLTLLMRDDVNGPVNLVAPEACAQGEFARVLGRVLGRPAMLPVPAFALRAALGDMASEMVLGGAIVRPTRLQQLGYTFASPGLEAALRVSLGR